MWFRSEKSRCSLYGFKRSASCLSTISWLTSFPMSGASVAPLCVTATYKFGQSLEYPTMGCASTGYGISPAVTCWHSAVARSGTYWAAAWITCKQHHNQRLKTATSLQIAWHSIQGYIGWDEGFATVKHCCLHVIPSASSTFMLFTNRVNLSEKQSNPAMWWYCLQHSTWLNCQDNLANVQSGLTCLATASVASSGRSSPAKTDIMTSPSRRCTMKIVSVHIQTACLSGMHQPCLSRCKWCMAIYTFD